MLGRCGKCSHVVEFDTHMEGGQAECPYCSEAFLCVNDVTEDEFYGSSGTKKMILISSICCLVAAGAIGGGIMVMKNKGGDETASNDAPAEQQQTSSTDELASLFNNDPTPAPSGSSRGGMDNGMSMGMDNGMMSMDNGMMGMDGGMAGGAGTFTASVLPIMQRNCTKCHGADKSRGGLRLHTRNDAMDAVVAGNPNGSELYKRIILSPDHDEVMPPNGNVLSAQEQNVIKTWIASGAK